MKKKCLIIDDMHESIVPLLEEIGIEPHYAPKISRSEILDCIGQFEGVLVRSKTTIDKEFIDKATKLEFIGRAGAGLDKIDVAYVEARNIEILNAPEGNRDALAEHAMGMLLNLLNKINAADREVRNWVWDREGNRGVELSDKTVGIVGYGYMGQAFVQRLRAFDCRILVYDKFKKGFGTKKVEEVSLEKLFQKTDILSLHVPLTEETRGWMNKTFFESFRKPVYLLNTARGEIVPIADLLSLLDSGKILGAALDVLEKEKFEALTSEEKQRFENLFARKNVVLSPHVAGWTFASYKRINEVLVSKIAGYYRIDWNR
ncbi:NAD(P)-dependent oxidoreductase [Roseivirga thermotolerans]|jgi:D-3-phosphoglycerate dehydrogenase|uniref:2-hydroxyacid dehydrogenase n=2 Tax=Roseivirga TaxID=290180 RepID=A0ABQ3I384_9BACT|nr:NAD(P)-dependent oxidoreductase [Roseivirga thermotolerans]GHE60346.1 2-hydroxyacid dehydrogenase [Roseivirga thermotolerans]|tara:strand:- start:14 stop:964 length:951 start_codon:yes stop_codon:yes gene_type:complete